MAAVQGRFAAVSLVKDLLHQVLEEVARVGVVKEAVPPRELSKKEQEAERRAEAKLDKMITIMDHRVPDKPNEEKLEIFQKLSKMAALEEFSLASAGAPLTPTKLQATKAVRAAPAPLQRSMGRAVTPTKYRSNSTATEPEVEAPVEAVAVVQVDTAKSEAVNVYKCIKCGQAFEKINLFVKHFIQNHKDIINANRNSKTFSFSNYWSKIKVKPNGEEIVPLEAATEKTETKDDKKEVKKKLPGVKEDRDLEMECESVTSPAPKVSRKPNSKKPPRKQDMSEEIVLEPIESSTFVFDVGTVEEVVEEAVPIDSYQCIPLSEIKVENPLEQLPMFEEQADVLEEQEGGLEELMVVEDEEMILGTVSASLLVVTDLLDKVISSVVKGSAEEEVVEVFMEEVVDTELGSVRHQVYIKDFHWLPLEDQFEECTVEERRQVDRLFAIRALEGEEEQRKAVKALLLEAEDVAHVREFARRIVGEAALPAAADHGQAVAARPRVVAADHCYGMRRRPRPPPPALALLVTGRKVVLAPAPPSARPAIPRKQPKLRRATNNNPVMVERRRRAPAPRAPGGGRVVEMVCGGRSKGTLQGWRDNNNRMAREEELRKEEEERKIKEAEKQQIEEERRIKEAEKQKAEQEVMKMQQAEELKMLEEIRKESERQEQHRRTEGKKLEEEEKKKLVEKHQVEEKAPNTKKTEETKLMESKKEEATEPENKKETKDRNTVLGLIMEMGVQGESSSVGSGKGRKAGERGEGVLEKRPKKRKLLLEKRNGEESVVVGDVVVKRKSLVEEVMGKRKKMEGKLVGKEKKVEESSSSLAATLAGLEDLLAGDTDYLATLTDPATVEEVIQQASLVCEAPRAPPGPPLRPPGPPPCNLPEEITIDDGDDMGDLLEAAMAASDIVNASFDHSNVYGIKQEVEEVEEVPVTLEISDYPVKQELVEGLHSADMAVAHFLSSFAAPAVKAEPVEVEEGLTVLDMLGDLGGGQEEQEEQVDLVETVETVDRCTECFLRLPNPSYLALHALGHRRPGVEARAAASPLPALALPRVRVPPDAMRRFRSLRAASGASSQGAAGKETAGQVTTLQALDSLLGQAEVLVCAVCSKDTFPSLAALRRHLAYHPHSQCRGKV